MEDKPSTSNTEITKEEISNENLNTKDKKSKKEKNILHKLGFFSMFNKKSDSPKANKKSSKSRKSLPLGSNSSVQLSQDDRSQSAETFNLTPNNNTESKQDNDTELTSDMDNEISLDEDIKTSSGKENVATLDKDNLMASDKDHKTTLDENNEPSIDKETIELTSNDTDTTLEREMEAKLTVSDDTESAIKNDIESTANISTEVIAEKCSSNDQQYSSLNVCSEKHYSTAETSKCHTNDSNDSGYDNLHNSYDVSQNTSHDNSDNNTEDARITEDTSTAAIEDHTDNKADLKRKDNEYDENRLVVLRELVETEKEYIQILSQKVDDIIKALKDSEAVGSHVSIPKCLSSLEKDTRTLNKDNNMISNNKIEPSLFIVD